MRSQPPTAAEFCQVYYQQERQYLAQYSHSSPGQPLQDLANAIGAMSDWVPIFERLDQAAPPSIEPDVHNILDALNQEQQAAGQEFSNPLGALASGHSREPNGPATFPAAPTTRHVSPLGDGGGIFAYTVLAMILLDDAQRARLVQAAWPAPARSWPSTRSRSRGDVSGYACARDSCGRTATM